MKDKRSLLILNVQIIVFNDKNICVFEIFLNVLNRAYHVSSSGSNPPSFLCPIFLGIFPPLSLYPNGIAHLFHRQHDRDFPEIDPGGCGEIVL